MLRVLLPLAALLLLVLAGSCGDDEEKGDRAASPEAEATLGEYIAQVDEIQDDLTKVVDDLGFEQAFADPAAARASVSAAIDLTESAVEALRALNPPGTADAAHNELIAAAENLTDVANVLNEDLQGVEAGAEFDRIKADAEAAGSSLSRALERAQQACQEMVALAEGNMINVILNCPEEL